MDKKSIKGNYIHKTLINTSPVGAGFIKRNIIDLHSKTSTYVPVNGIFFF